MILREIPDVPPRPVTPQNIAFRRWLYPRWGKENALISARTRYAEIERTEQPFSIKAAWGGVSEHRVGSRRLCVDDDCYLVLNEDQTYSSVFQGDPAVNALCLFMRRGLPAEVNGALVAPLEAALADDGCVAPRAVEFAENLRPHDAAISPILRLMRQKVAEGLADEAWVEEQCHQMLARLIEGEHRLRHRADRIDSIKPATREELLRRLGWAADFMQSSYADAISLDDVARAARLSKFHLIRLFRRVHGVTPHVFLQNKRARVARRLIESTALELNEIAVQVGFGTRFTMFRQLRRVYGASGLALRRPAPALHRPARLAAEVRQA